MNRIFVIRHGETHWNREGRFQGSLDIPLNETGRAQAEATAHVMKQLAPDAQMFSSHLMRARDTAATIASTLNTDLHFDVNWRERGYGVQEGATYKEWQKRDPAGYALYKTNDPDYTPQGGETGRQFYERSVNAFEALAQRAGDVGCVVTHGGVISALYRWANQLPLASPREWDVPNCGLNEFVCDGQTWRLVRFADIAHLKDMLDDVTV